MFELLVVFLFGIYLSAAFAGVIFNKKNVIILFLLTISVVCTMAFLQVSPKHSLGWKLLPLVGHLPNLLFLTFYYHKRFSTSVVAICTSFLLCQPPKWLYSMCLPYLGTNVFLPSVFYFLAFAVTLAFGLYFSQSISKIFNKDTRSVCIFGSVPIIFYIVNFFLEIYTNAWTTTSPAITEFYRFIICIAYLLFCIIYYKEYEEKSDLERKEQIINIAIEQQQKEMEKIRSTEQELRILRHDMRLFLNTLLLCLQKGDYDNAYKLVNTLTEHIEDTRIHRYCNNDTINYILSNFVEKCEKAEINYHINVKLDTLSVDEILFSSILSNGLDNAFNAVYALPVSSRNIYMMLKYENEHLLLSIRNPYSEKPIFFDGLPIATQKGHGYGTQSIRYATERLGGNYMFSIEDEQFLLRVIL